MLPEKNVELDPREVDAGDDDEQWEDELDDLRPAAWRIWILVMSSM